MNPEKFIEDIDLLDFERDIENTHVNVHKTLDWDSKISKSTILNFEEAVLLMLAGKVVMCDFSKMKYTFAKGMIVAWSETEEEWCVANISGAVQRSHWRVLYNNNKSCKKEEEE